MLLLRRLVLAVSSRWECSFPCPYGLLSHFLLVSAQILAFLAILYKKAILYSLLHSLVFLHSNYHFLRVHAKLLQSCWTQCNPMVSNSTLWSVTQCNPMVSWTQCNPMVRGLQAPLVYGILQARIREWVAMFSSRGSSQPRDQTYISYVSCIGRWVLYHKCHLNTLFSSVTYSYYCYILLLLSPTARM